MCRVYVLLFLVLVLETRWSESSCEQPESQRSASNVSLITLSVFRQPHSFVKTLSFHAQESPSFRLSAHNLLRRYNDIDYDSFVGLMGRRNAGKCNRFFFFLIVHLSFWEVFIICAHVFGFLQMQIVYRPNVKVRLFCASNNIHFALGQHREKT